jgi:hypothetical protein
MSDVKESCFRTGYILGPRSDWFWFLGLPFIAVAVALGVREWLPAVAAASFALWITVPHHFATWLRTYGFEDERKRWKARLILGPILILSLTWLGLKHAPLTTLLLIMLWDHQHGIMQQYGFGRIYDFKAQTGSPSTRNFDLYLSWALYGNMLLATPYWSEVWIMECYRWGFMITPDTVKLVQWLSNAMLVSMGIAYVAHLVASVRQGYKINPIKISFLASSYFLWYFVAYQHNSFIMFQVANRIMHGFQYNIIVYSYVRKKVGKQELKKGLMAAVGKPRNLVALLVLCAVYALGFNMIIGNGLEDFGLGLFEFKLSFDSLRDVSGILGVEDSYGLFALAVMHSASVVHYYFDSFIWKVRDTKIQEGL